VAKLFFGQPLVFVSFSTFLFFINLILEIKNCHLQILSGQLPCIYFFTWVLKSLLTAGYHTSTVSVAHCHSHYSLTYVTFPTCEPLIVLLPLHCICSTIPNVRRLIYLAHKVKHSTGTALHNSHLCYSFTF
jgi:hypothetical protein